MRNLFRRRQLCSSVGAVASAPRFIGLATAITLSVLGTAVESRAFAQAGDCAEGWQSPGTINGPVTALAFAPSIGTAGSIVYGGSFGVSYPIGGGFVETLSIGRFDLATSTFGTLGAGFASSGASLPVVNAIAPLSGAFAGQLIAVGSGIRVSALGAASIAARYAGGTWTSIWNEGTAGVEARAVVTLANGDVVIGGTFYFTPTGVPTAGVARYNPTTGAWSTLGTGVQSGRTVYCLLPLADGSVVVGGDFSSAGGKSTPSKIAKYTPSTDTWTPLGTQSLGGPPSASSVAGALALLPNGDLLTTYFGASSTKLYRYSAATNTWTAVGTADLVPANAIALLPNDEVLTGGSTYFLSSTSTTPIARNLARCSLATGAWREFAGGTDGTVNAVLSLPDGRIVVGGAFGVVGAGTNTSATQAWNFAIYQSPAAPPTISVQPVPVAAAVGGKAAFYVGSTAPGGTITYQWRRNTTPINIALNPSAATPSLQLSNIQAGDAGTYDCIVTGACNGVATASDAAALSLSGASCGADFNGDGFITFEDFDAFVAAFEAGC